MTRYVALDIESTGLDKSRAVPLEIAAIEYEPAEFDTRPAHKGRTILLAPRHRMEVFATADPEALTINRFFERGVYRDWPMGSDETAEALGELCDFLRDATIVGANPAYDTAVLGRYLRERIQRVEPWHHRLYDVECATAAVKGLNSIPSLKDCLTLWDLPPQQDAHTALGDARAALAVFHAIRGATK